MLPGDNCYASIAQRVGKCAICKGDIPRGEDMMVERKTSKQFIAIVYPYVSPF